MASELFTSDGKRKYLTTEETARFIAAARAQERPELRTFALVLAYTGCRISEALELTPERIDLSEKVIRFRTLKRRNDDVFRSVPVPDDLIDTLEIVHGIRKAMRGRGGQRELLLWPFKRTQAWNHINRMMTEAGIDGPHATPKGMRHGFGVRMAQKTRNPRLIQKLLGHKYLETTAIYMDLVGEEERAEVVGAWD